LADTRAAPYLKTVNKTNSRKEEIAMKMLIAGAFAFAVLATGPAHATESLYFVTVDTVGNCSVSQGKPSAGQKALGEAGG